MEQLTNEERQVIVNLLLSYKGLSIAEAGTVLQIIQKIQMGIVSQKTPSDPIEEIIEKPQEEKKDTT